MGQFLISATVTQYIPVGNVIITSFMVDVLDKLIMSRYPALWIVIHTTDLSALVIKSSEVSEFSCN